MKRIVIFLSAMAFLGALSFAQESTGEIIGKVVLADGAPLPGVSVTLTGTTYGKNVLVTSEQGNYRYPKLSPGNYTMRFELEGFKTVIRKDFRLSIGSPLNMNVIMEPGTIQEEILVVGTAPMINTRKANVSLNVTNEVASLLPAARTAREIISLAPGIMTADPVYAMQGSGTTNGLGTRNNQGEYNVDGASFISTYGHGGMPTGVNMNRVEETQVTTSNQDITNVLGGITVNFVSKRGGNRVSGDFYLDMMDHSMQSTKSIPDYMKTLGLVGRPGIQRVYEYGATLGGPIWKDHLWFFGSWGVTDSSSRGQSGLIADRYYTPDYYGKINAQWGKTTAEFSFNHSDSTAVNVDWSSTIGGPNKVDHATPTNVYTGNISTTLWDKLLLSAKLTYFHKTNATNQTNNVWQGAGDVAYDAGRTYGPQNRFYTYNTFKGVPYNTESSGYWQRYGYNEKRPYVIAEANYFTEKFLGGDHEFKVGFDLNYGRYINEYMAPNQAFIWIFPSVNYSSHTTFPGGDTLNAPNPASPSFGAITNYWAQLRTYADRFGEVRTERQGIFAQDVLTYGRLTVNVGLRADKSAFHWLDANLHPMEFNGPGGAENVFSAWDQWQGPITIKGGKLPLDLTWSPRISAAYDIFGNGKDVVKLSYANYGGTLNNASGAGSTNQLGFRPGFQTGNTRGEFNLPYLDLNGNLVPELSEVNNMYNFPTPTQVNNMIAVGQAEQKTWLAAHPGQDPPWNYYTYPGWQFMAFTGPLLGKNTPKGSPNDFLLNYTPTRTLELTVGYEKQLTSDLKVSAMYAYKKEYNFPFVRGYWGTPSNYTLMPLQQSYIAGKSVDGWDMYQGLPVTQLPAANGYAVTNYKSDTFYYYFNGLEIIINKKLSNKWMANASLDLMSWKQHQDLSEVSNYTLFNYYQDGVVGVGEYFSGEQPQNARWHVKVNGLYQLPFGLSISAIFDAREGYPVIAYETSFLGQLLPKLGSKYGDVRLPTMWYLNLALEKTWTINEYSSVTVHVTGYNISDQIATTRLNTAPLPVSVTHPNAVQPGRIFQFGIRYSFK